VITVLSLFCASSGIFHVECSVDYIVWLIVWLTASAHAVR